MTTDWPKRGFSTIQDPPADACIICGISRDPAIHLLAQIQQEIEEEHYATTWQEAVVIGEAIIRSRIEELDA